MHRWSVGEIEVVRVEDASFALPTDYPVPDWMVPAFAPNDREIGLAFSAIAIRAADRRIVVDPWLADDAPRARPDAAAHVDGLLAELAGAGFAPSDVDTVVNTHIDGIGWNTRPHHDGWVPAFPNARYLFPAAELAAVAAGEDIDGGDGVAVLVEHGVVDEVPPSAGIEIGPGVTLSDAPGHNAGHLAVRIESGGDVAVIPGHLILTPIQVDDPTFDVGEPELAMATATRQRILTELGQRRGLLVTTLLGGPGGGRVEQAGAGYRLRVDQAP